MLSNILSWPHTVHINDTDNTQLVCEEPLRVLPKKRIVCRGHWQQQPVVVKLFLDKKHAKRHARREETGSRALEAANIKTPVLLYSGQLNDKTPVLIFEELPESQTALHLWQNLNNNGERQEFLSQLLLELANHHQAGLLQKDLHLGNFLYSQQHWYTIDGDAVDSRSTGTALNIEKSLANLALFFAQLAPRFDNLFEPALREYASQRQFDLTTLHQSLLKKLAHERQQRRHKYIKKSYRSCSEFVRQNSFRRVAIYRRDADPDRIQQLLANPDKLITKGEILKDGNSATVARISHPDGDWVIKRYNIKNILHGLKRCLRPSRAWTSWGNTQRLNISGMATPQAFAMIENRIGPFRLGAYYICDHVIAPDALEYFQSIPQEQSIECVASRNFISLFKRLHQLGIHHGDCKATNFLVQENQPCVIDLDAMREFSSRKRFLRAYQVDRERFLRNWQAMPELQHWFDERLP